MKCHRYKQEYAGGITKIHTVVNTGQLEGDDIYISLQGRRYKLSSVILHDGMDTIIEYTLNLNISY